MSSKPMITAALGAFLLVGCAAHTAQAGDPCYFNGIKYSDGGASCQNSSEFRCDDGEWMASARACKATEPQIASTRPCDFGGISFADGSASCQAGTQFRCEDGKWSSLRMPCSVGDSPVRVIPSGSTCMFGGATVSSGSTICQSGATFLCNDGAWLNLGTVCR